MYQHARPPPRTVTHTDCYRRRPRRSVRVTTAPPPRTAAPAAAATRRALSPSPDAETGRTTGAAEAEAVTDPEADAGAEAETEAGAELAAGVGVAE
jgi:hypothetical protein